MSEVNRRQFLGGAAGGAILAAHWANWAMAAPGQAWPNLPSAKIYKVYAGRTGDGYLTHPTDEIARFEKHFAELEKKVEGVKLIGGDLLPPAKVEEVATKLKGADALLIVHLSGHGGDAPVLTKLIDVGLPTALFSQPFSGHGWMYFPQWHKQGRKVILLPSSDWADLYRAITLLRTPAMLKQTKILAIGAPHGTPVACSAEAVKKKLGAALVTVPNDRVMEIFKSIDPKEAEAEAKDYWLSQAKQIVEPTRPEIIDSARLYLATKKLMMAENAQAVCSTHCMGTPRGCLTFSKLNDLGFAGACEGDIDSTLTMLLFAYAFRAPGFITDPVVDESKNALVQFHCTSFTRRADGSRMPFLIRNQTDSGGGVALQVQWQVGEPVTMAKLVNLDTMLAVPGKITETGASPLACRTQFTQTVRDARHLFLNWGGGAIVAPGSPGDLSQYAGAMPMLHRAVFYGDHMRGMKRLGDLMGYKVIEEDIAS